VHNDYIFNRVKQNSFIHVILLATHWICTWFFLQSTDKRQEMDFGCNWLKSIARDLYNQSSWHFDIRLTYWCIGGICFYLCCLDGLYIVSTLCDPWCSPSLLFRWLIYVSILYDLWCNLL
jgi:hypothetical protein